MAQRKHGVDGETKDLVDSNFGLVLVLYTGGTMGMKLNSDKGKLVIVSFLFCAYIVLMILFCCLCLFSCMFGFFFCVAERQVVALRSTTQTVATTTVGGSPDFIHLYKVLCQNKNFEMQSIHFCYAI